MQVPRAGRLLLWLLTLALPARADDGGEARPGRINLFGRRFSLLAGARVYLSFADETRESFGTANVWPDFRLWHFDSPKGPHFAWEVHWTRLAREDRTADFVTTTLGARFVLAHTDRAVVPFWIVRAGPYFARTDHGRRRRVAGANTELGLAIAQRVVVVARYDLLGRVNGFQLSGYTARLDVKVF